VNQLLSQANDDDLATKGEINNYVVFTTSQAPAWRYLQA
jgi:hypothetical protein